MSSTATNLACNGSGRRIQSRVGPCRPEVWDFCGYLMSRPRQILRNLWDAPNLLLQKLPGPEFTVTTKVTFTPGADDEKTGLIIMGMDYAYVSVEKRAEGLFISQAICKDADRHAPERASTGIPVKGNTFYLRAGISKQAVASFSYSIDGINFTPIGEPFTARQGSSSRSKVAIFSQAPSTTPALTYAPPN